MRNTCPKCNNALTVRDVIQNTCSKCSPLRRSGIRGWQGARQQFKYQSKLRCLDLARNSRSGL